MLFLCWIRWFDHTYHVTGWWRHNSVDTPTHTGLWSEVLADGGSIHHQHSTSISSTMPMCDDGLQNACKIYGATQLKQMRTIHIHILYCPRYDPYLQEKHAPIHKWVRNEMNSCNIYTVTDASITYRKHIANWILCIYFNDQIITAANTPGQEETRSETLTCLTQRMWVLEMVKTQ